MSSRKIFASGLGASTSAWRSTITTSLPASATRSFTSTASRSAKIPTFAPSSSKELDQLLADFRHRVILPAYLPRYQRKTIYNPKFEKRLQSDPIVIELDGEIIKFRHMNPLKGQIPNHRRSVKDILDKFEESDFQNLRPLLEGVHEALPSPGWEFIIGVIRRTALRGQLYPLIECARSVKTTGLSLGQHEMATEFLHHIQMKAVNADWKASETVQALRWAEMVVDMLISEEHQPKFRNEPARIPGELPRDRDPLIIMAPLHLAATQALRPDAPDDLIHKVARYAQDIVRLWPADKPVLEVHSQPARAAERRLGYLNHDAKFVRICSPLLFGLETAAKAVTGREAELKTPGLAAELQTRAKTLRAELDRRAGRMTNADRKMPIWAMKSYEKLVANKGATASSQSA